MQYWNPIIFLSDIPPHKHTHIIYAYISDMHTHASTYNITVIKAVGGCSSSLLILSAVISSTLAAKAMFPFPYLLIPLFSLSFSSYTLLSLAH